MDGHVLEDATTALDVLGRRRRRVARAQLDHDRLADLGRRDRLLDATKVGVEAALERGHELDALAARVVDRLDGLQQIGRDRLLAEDVLTRVGTRTDLVCVELRGRADPDGLNVRVVDDVHVGVAELHARVVGGRGLGLGDRRVRDDDRLRLRN